MHRILVGPLAFLLCACTAHPSRGKRLDWKEYGSTVGISVQKESMRTTCTGILLTPQVVLTAAHCVVGFKSAQVTTSPKLQKGSIGYDVVEGAVHPGYQGNIVGKSVDVGLFFLATPVASHVTPPIMAAVNPYLEFERIGYGGRSGKNVRTWVTSFFHKWFGSYVKTRDQFGMGGDSGGPVFQRHEAGLRLVGVHTGREVKNGQLAEASYIQTLGDNEISWIRDQIAKHGGSLK